MTRNRRIAAIGAVAVVGVVAAILCGAFYASRQVRPFYEQALRLEPEILEQGGRELESRATALYSDAQHEGHWQALFTADQINGWLATQLAEHHGGELPPNLQDPRVAITRDKLTLGFRTHSGGVDTVISVEAAVSLTETGAVAIELLSVHAGTLPLPVMPLAEQLAATCQSLDLPVRWTRDNNRPVAIVEVDSDSSKHAFRIQSIALGADELYVAGYTERKGSITKRARKSKHETEAKSDFALDDFELRLTPANKRSALEIARRPSDQASDSSSSGR